MQEKGLGPPYNTQQTAAEHTPVERVRLLVRGIVQSVGFRPYVYRLAGKHGLAGFVMNSAEGAVVELEGPREAIDSFMAELPVQGPPLMQISGVEKAALAIQGEAGFLIRDSATEAHVFTLVPPDVCVCDECLAEIRDPANRRYEYPFTNCTNCGPRYSIIVDLPYDRKQTTMAGFALCEQCRREYQDPADRRFHAQPNACPVCGPRLSLAIPGHALSTSQGAREILNAAADIILAGGIVALKGLGGYQLACDARQSAAIAELRRRKHRSEKPFAVMAGDLATAEKFCLVSNAERVVLQGRERPIVLLRRGEKGSEIEGVSPGNPSAGVMLPSTPMHDLLFEVLRKKGAREAVLVMTSGNLSEEPIVIDNAEAEERLAGIADAFVHHNRTIHTRVDDSLVRVVEEQPMLMRRARGYCPAPVWLGLGTAEVLACGAQQKSTLCLTRQGFALLSQHLGDLENFETLRFFEETLERMSRLFHIAPQTAAHDLHPGYLSTQFARKLPGVRLIGVQHHHAHIASCMAEHRLRGKVIGLAWDGTGLGTDGTIWGGEFLVADLAGFERAAHLRTVLLAGGDSAVREPWRVARSYLHDAFDTAIPNGVAFSQPVAHERVRLVDAMIEKRIRTVETSSCGRLFDAVAALIGLRQTVSFEGQAAIEIEATASIWKTDAGANEQYGFNDRYDFDLNGEGPLQVDLRPMVRQIVRETQKGEPVGHIAARFHITLIAAAVAVCLRIRDRYSLSTVCLSGGCFQNVLLLRGTVAGLRREGFDVFFQRLIPCNDGGISVGQAAIACESIARGA